MKQNETLEEAAERFLIEGAREFKTAKQVLIGFANWQAERMYSEEEVIKILESLVEHPTKPGYKRRDIVKFIEQFKKK
jgi:hypothetical protein